MPNIKSAKKRVKQEETRNARNVARKSSIKSAIKKVLVAVEQKDLDQARLLLKDVQAQLGRAKSKRVVHANTAARKLSRLAQRVAQASK